MKTYSYAILRAEVAGWGIPGPFTKIKGKILADDHELLRLCLGRAMAPAVVRRTLTAAAWVRAQSNPVGFVVDKVALGQVFLRVLRFSPVNIIPSWAPLFQKLKKKFFHPFSPSLIFIRGRTKVP
jgi:hypothetical protein